MCVDSLQATSWTQGVKHSKGAAPDEDRKQDAPASPSSADNADEENLKAAIKVCPGFQQTNSVNRTDLYVMTAG